MIVAQDLAKNFASRIAVDGVSFYVPAGAICGFLGPNGAGKSTSMRMIAGALAPDRGQVLVDGADVWSQPREARSRMGWLPERAPVHPDASVDEFIQWSAQMKGIEHRQAPKSAEEAMQRCGLLEVRHRLCGELSRGFRQRVGLAAALASRPKVLLLDEPTAGLDPAQVMAFREMLQSLRGSVTVLLSTHVLAEVEATCDRLIVLDRGRVVAMGEPDEVRRKLGVAARLQIEVDDPVRAEVAVAEAGLRLEMQRPLDGAWHAMTASGDVTLEARSTLSRSLARDGVAVRRMDVEAGPLEDAFKRLALEAS
ncbi:MAG: ABC transporter ATP-binding protein [Planctomycetes bacterium]|nr:ABC transporter ATP-binding protein [Planctomycetota bacterium]